LLAWLEKSACLLLPSAYVQYNLGWEKVNENKNGIFVCHGKYFHRLGTIIQYFEKPFFSLIVENLKKKISHWV
jgi:hypothetical protein